MVVGFAVSELLGRAGDQTKSRFAQHFGASLMGKHKLGSNVTCYGTLLIRNIGLAGFEDRP